MAVTLPLASGIKVVAQVKVFEHDDFPVLAQQLCVGCSDNATASLSQVLKDSAEEIKLGSKSLAEHLAVHGSTKDILSKVRNRFVRLLSVCQMDDLAMSVYTQCTKLETPCTPAEFNELSHQVRAWFKQECTFKNIGISTGTDKTFLHNYHRIYDPLLAPYRSGTATLLTARLPSGTVHRDSIFNADGSGVVKLLEIGMKEGASVKLWKHYFQSFEKKSQPDIYAIDVAAPKHCQPCTDPKGGSKVFSGSQADIRFLKTVIKHAGRLK